VKNISPGKFSVMAFLQQGSVPLLQTLKPEGADCTPSEA